MQPTVYWPLLNLLCHLLSWRFSLTSLSIYFVLLFLYLLELALGVGLSLVTDVVQRCVIRHCSYLIITWTPNTTVSAIENDITIQIDGKQCFCKNHWHTQQADPFHKIPRPSISDSDLNRNLALRSAFRGTLTSIKSSIEDLYKKKSFYKGSSQAQTIIFFQSRHSF